MIAAPFGPCGHPGCDSPACVSLNVWDPQNDVKEFPACGEHIADMALLLFNLAGKPKVNVWIYPGERRPVVVEAPTREEAVEAVRRSGQWDGFGPDSVVPLEEFMRACAPREGGGR